MVGCQLRFPNHTLNLLTKIGIYDILARYIKRNNIMTTEQAINFLETLTNKLYKESKPDMELIRNLDSTCDVIRESVGLETRNFVYF